MPPAKVTNTEISFYIKPITKHNRNYSFNIQPIVEERKLWQCLPRKQGRQANNEIPNCAKPIIKHDRNYSSELLG